MNAVQKLLQTPSKAKAWVRYREILNREETPEPGDAEALREAMATIGKDREALAADVAAIRRALTLQATIEECEKLLPATREASAAVEAHKIEMDRIIKELKVREFELHRALIAIGSQANESTTASVELSQLRREHRELFGLPPIAKHDKPVHSIQAMTGPSSKPLEPDYSEYAKPLSQFTVTELPELAPGTMAL